MLDELKEYLAVSRELLDYERQYREFVEPKKLRKQQLRILLFQKLKESGQDSSRYRGLATLSISLENKPVVTDEKAVIAALQNKGLKDYFSTEPHLTDLFYESILPAIKSGELEPLDGITLETKESLKILPSKAEPLTPA